MCGLLFFCVCIYIIVVFVVVCFVYFVYFFFFLVTFSDNYL